MVEKRPAVKEYISVCVSMSSLKVTREWAPDVVLPVQWLHGHLYEFPSRRARQG